MPSTEQLVVPGRAWEEARPSHLHPSSSRRANAQMMERSSLHDEKAQASVTVPEEELGNHHAEPSVHAVLKPGRRDASDSTSNHGRDQRMFAWRRAIENAPDEPGQGGLLLPAPESSREIECDRSTR